MNEITIEPTETRYAACTAHLGKALRFLAVNTQRKYISVDRLERHDARFICECGKHGAWYLRLMREVAQDG